jgi:hypothetical protein
MFNSLQTFSTTTQPALKSKPALPYPKGFKAFRSVRHSLVKRGLLIVFMLISLQSFGQAVLEPIRRPQLAKGVKRAYSKTIARTDTLPVSLPFFDDFTGAFYRSWPYPDSARWVQGSGVFINSRYPVGPPSYNVATFDGLDETGTPYQFSPTNAQSPTDILTSRPILLNEVVPAQADSVYLSFFWQAGGRAIQLAPNDTEDSLVLQFKAPDQADTWNSVWSVSKQSNNIFQFERIKVAREYLTADFQFRFVNWGAVNGNFDMWHIDYVYLDKGFIAASTSFEGRNEFAVSEKPSRLLRNYTAMPWNQFAAAPQRETNDSVSVRVNLFGLSRVFRFDGYVNQVYPNRAQIEFIPGESVPPPLNGNTPRSFESLFRVDLPVNDGLLKQVITEPTTVEYKFAIRSEATSPVFLNNDTASTRTDFRDYYAYDDGTPELSFSIGGDFAMAAVKYVANEQDTLTHINIHFTKMVHDISNQPFSLMVLKKLGTEETNYRDSVLLQQEVTVRYSGQLNGFTQYELRQPIIVTDTFYIGWQQTVGRRQAISVGYDVQNETPGTIFQNYAAVWEPFIDEPGSLLIRPVFANGVVMPDTESTAPTRVEARIFPNPTNDQFTVEGEAEEVSVYDLAGKRLITRHRQAGEELTIFVRGFKPGVYVVHVRNSGGSISVKKLVVNQ